jgi:uncharacterized damage-inducible protein DinB
MTVPEDVNERLLDALMESWERNNTIMINLLRALPDGGLAARATEGGPTVSQQFMHIHHERMVSLLEEAPEFARNVPEDEWAIERNPDRIVQMLTDSCQAVRNAIKTRIVAGRSLDLNYGHPVLMLQMLLWHEGYHHGQIKLALKIAGQSITDEQAGSLTWDVWRKRV